ncbi:apolipoprotein L3-like [Tachysurus ichikawai]
MEKPKTQIKKPPSVPPKVLKIVRAGGQALPGMVRSYSQPEYVGKNGRQELTVEENNAEDGIRSLTLQDTSQTSGESNDQGKNTSARSNDNEDIMRWWHSEERKFYNIMLDDIIQRLVHTRTFTQKAKNLKKALKVYDHLICDQGANLQGHIIGLNEVADSIDKVHKGVKIAGITGGTAGAVGIAAAVGGVILAPVTGGASLAVTAIGVGVAAAGGVTGASAAITNKVHTNMDRKKVETILQDHCTQIEEFEKCVTFICAHIDGLKKYNLSTLKGVDWTAVKMARMAHKLGDSVGAIGTVSKSSGLIQGLMLGLDMYFSKEDSKQLKKGSETKFAKQIRKVSKQMQTSLDQLMTFNTTMNSDDI